ncbi:calcium-binding protein [uncultured Shewanella sp.]|uniref:calcium-binding protein n=1 Tax=uncultured Shewanella sp. TaxID=173975 RepID=UPI00261F307F|nr:calcium-binding protein [uncultured Shewanella sp.]
MRAEIEERIQMEIIVDCYDTEEAAMGWYCYLENNLEFPFYATSTKGKSKLTIVGLADASECHSHMYVLVDFDGNDELLFPLENIEPLGTSNNASQAIEDWKYWLRQGYCF